jgi:hypothetical protein
LVDSGMRNQESVESVGSGNAGISRIGECGKVEGTSERVGEPLEQNDDGSQFELSTPWLV